MFRASDEVGGYAPFRPTRYRAAGQDPNRSSRAPHRGSSRFGLSKAIVEICRIPSTAITGNARIAAYILKCPSVSTGRDRYAIYLVDRLDGTASPRKVIEADYIADLSWHPGTSRWSAESTLATECNSTISTVLAVCFRWSFARLFRLAETMAPSCPRELNDARPALFHINGPQPGPIFGTRACAARRNDSFARTRRRVYLR